MDKGVILQMFYFKISKNKKFLKETGIKQSTIKNKVGLFVAVAEVAQNLNSWKYWENGKYTNREQTLNSLAHALGYAITLTDYKNCIEEVNQKVSALEIERKLIELDKKYKEKERKLFLKGREVAIALDSVFCLITMENYRTAIVKIFELAFILGAKPKALINKFYEVENE